MSEPASVERRERAGRPVAAPTAEHPTLDELLGYHAGELDDGDAERVQDHLLVCRRCLDAVLDLSTPIVLDLRFVRDVDSETMNEAFDSGFETNGRGQPNWARRQIAQFFETGQAKLQILPDLANCIEEVFTGFGEGETAAAAYEQRAADIFFECFDLAADGALRRDGIQHNGDGRGLGR